MPIGQNAQYNSIVHPGVTVTATQQPQELDLLRRVIRHTVPAVIIELGTGAGGLTLVLHETVPDTPLYTFDRSLATEGEYVTALPWRCHQYRRDWYGPAVVFCPGDLLGEGMLPQLEEALDLPGSKLILCDNGDKRQEFGMCGRELQAGDVIGVHDWNDEVHMADLTGLLGGFVPFMWEACEAMGRTMSWRFWVKE
jgi:hypothetical protein